MAYQFFSKNQTKPAISSSSLSPPPTNRQPARPPIHPPPVQPPQSAVANTPGPKHSKEEIFDPYAHDIPTGVATPHPHITVEKVNTAHIPSLTRITGLLLPIRYPSSFYTAIITDPVTASLSRVAIYHDHPVGAAPGSVASVGTDKVIGGIRCRLERIRQSEDSSKENQIQGNGSPTNLYIQTLHLLFPYRGCGVAASLLNSLLFVSPPDRKEKDSYQVSELVRHYNIRSVTAHVHEANEEGLEWYIARGFRVDRDVAEYYRRLKPSGAKIVRLDLNWNEDEAHPPKEENAQTTTSPGEMEDEDWEKVEAEDGEEGDHGIQQLNESQFLENQDVPSRKRKAEDDNHKPEIQ
ncbi:Acyl-CoA N-acyltransferase [Penicillium griseofulvum]|uniref:Acyl-CoA N-acyltransferase n=1 Tax=Penicillium patulum TaxID=5078 RepID=A0A135LZH7_PENPA|nr:Acyl-CoA N-acyltransferase [Penicillium griseofulvum]KXG54341.1 Acyl-CoA N-acyltransferase [Penicillium griseofulvum]